MSRLHLITTCTATSLPPFLGLPFCLLIYSFLLWVTLRFMSFSSPRFMLLFYSFLRVLILCLYSITSRPPTISVVIFVVIRINFLRFNPDIFRFGLHSSFSARFIFVWTWIWDVTVNSSLSAFCEAFQLLYCSDFLGGSKKIKIKTFLISYQEALKNILSNENYLYQIPLNSTLISFSSSFSFPSSFSFLFSLKKNKYMLKYYFFSTSSLFSWNEIYFNKKAVGLLHLFAIQNHTAF